MRCHPVWWTSLKSVEILMVLYANDAHFTQFSVHCICVKPAKGNGTYVTRVYQTCLGRVLYSTHVTIVTDFVSVLRSYMTHEMCVTPYFTLKWWHQDVVCSVCVNVVTMWSCQISWTDNVNVSQLWTIRWQREHPGQQETMSHGILVWTSMSLIPDVIYPSCVSWISVLDCQFEEAVMHI